MNNSCLHRARTSSITHCAHILTAAHLNPRANWTVLGRPPRFRRTRRGPLKDAAGTPAATISSGASLSVHTFRRKAVQATGSCRQLFQRSAASFFSDTTRKARGRSPERDFDRQLDTIGRAEAERIGAAAAVMDQSPTLLVCSTAERCKQTAAAFMAAMSTRLTCRSILTSTAPPGSLYGDMPSRGERQQRHDRRTQSDDRGSLQTALPRAGGKQPYPGRFPTAGLAASTPQRRRALAARDTAHP